MNSIVFLQSSDFAIQPGKKGKVLACKLPDVALVLFYSDNCGPCQHLKPIFKALPKHLPHTRFGACNIDKEEMKVAHMSAGTLAPIKYTPYIILYINHRPVMSYDGERTLPKIVDFVTEVTKRLNNTKNFSANSKVDSEFAKYTTGIPYNILCDDEGSCYLTYNEIYSGKSDKCENGECCYYTFSEIYGGAAAAKNQKPQVVR
jgi:thiol-disulfide isomerase/thioredoxin